MEAITKSYHYMLRVCLHTAWGLRTNFIGCSSYLSSLSY
jgi:hypothetical protein